MLIQVFFEITTPSLKHLRESTHWKTVSIKWTLGLEYFFSS